MSQSCQTALRCTTSRDQPALKSPVWWLASQVHHARMGLEGQHMFPKRTPELLAESCTGFELHDRFCLSVGLPRCKRSNHNNRSIVPAGGQDYPGLMAMQVPLSIHIMFAKSYLHPCWHSFFSVCACTCVALAEPTTQLCHLAPLPALSTRRRAQVGFNHNNVAPCIRPVARPRAVPIRRGRASPHISRSSLRRSSHTTQAVKAGSKPIGRLARRNL